MIVHDFGDGEKVDLTGFAIAYDYWIEGKGYFAGQIKTGPYSIQANNIESVELKKQIVELIVADIIRREEGPA
jgi:hypothetical protein